MKIDIAKLKGAGWRNLKASVELINAIEVIEKYAPPDEEPEVILVKAIPARQQKLLTNGSRPRKPKKPKLSARRIAQLRRVAKKLQRKMKANRQECPHCHELFQANSIERHKTACKRNQKQAA